MNGSIRQLSKGTWELRYDAPPDGTGRRRFLSETVKGNKKEAERVLRERLAAIENGGYVAKEKETVTQFLRRWLATYAATNTSLRTQEGYRGNIERHIIPTIGNIGLQSLTGRQIQGIYAAMLDRRLSARTCLHIQRVLRTALAFGVKTGLLSRNVADAATPPRPERKQSPMWNPDTISDFLDAAENSRFCGLYHLAVFTGMRRSELAGLKWHNVDLVIGRLSVTSTLQRIPGHGLVEGQPKTPRSRRSIALKAEAVSLLHSIRGKQIEDQLAVGELWPNLGYVFTQEDGTPIDPESVSKDFCSIVRKERLPRLTFHGLRHAHATLALTAGVNLKIVSERLGHSTIAVTMDVYSHVLPGTQEEAAQAVEDLLTEARRKRLGTD